MIEPPRSYHRRVVVGACALLLLGPRWLCAQEGAVSATKAKNELSLRVRMEWGGGAGRRWVGTAEVPGGRCELPVPLGVEADEPGSMGVIAGRWFVEPRSPRTYDGVDLTIRGPPEARLIVVLSDPEQTSQSRHEIPLAALVDAPFHTSLDPSGNRLAIRRAPGDRLRVRPVHEALIFDPGETLQLLVEPHRLLLPAGTALQLTASVCPARTTKSLSSQTFDLTTPADDDAWPDLAAAIPLPTAEGVYDVVLELARRDLSSRLLRQTALERRVVQVVVLSKTAPPRAHDADPQSAPVLVEIDPASPGWWDRMKHATVPAPLRRGPLGNVRPSTRTLIDASYVELPPTKEPEDPAWQAYPLSVARPGVPHVIELEYPANAAQSLAVSLLEPNALGSVVPLGVDLGLYVDESDVEPTHAKRVQRFVVWPKTAAPLLVIVNRRRDAPAVYGKIRLLGPRATALPYRPWAVDETPTLPTAKIPAARPDGRSLVAYLDRPLFPDNFGATSAVDSGGDTAPRCLDDWVTFYDGARRLIEYLHYSGYNGLLLTVAADGSAIYPSALLEPTPRYDDGAFFSNGQDPIRKDVLELLLRMFDREGLLLYPAVQFATPLPRLEQARRAGNRNLAPLGLDGKAWTESHATDGGLAPHYNPLHPRVRQEMHDVVAELMERYGHHPYLAAPAVHLTAEGYTQLPGVEWGLDAETLAEFYRSIGQPAPTSEETAAATARVLDRHREAWIAWRQSTLTQFYGELGTLTAKTNRRLYLPTAHVWQRPDLLRRLQPSLPVKSPFEPILHESGLDPAALAALPQVQWLRAYRESPLDAPAEHGVNVELNRDATLDRASVRGTVIFHEPQAQRLESLEKQSPFQPAYVRMVTQAAAVGSAARRSLVQSLATHDAATIFDGGWLLPLQVPNDLRQLTAVVRALPYKPFVTLPGGPSHVVVRTLIYQERTYLYVVNDSPWPMTVTLDVAHPGGFPAVWNLLGDEERRGAVTAINTQPPWRAQLQPYDVVAGYYSAPGVKFTNIRTSAPPEVAQRLEARIKQLWARCGSLQRPTKVELVANAGFETTGTAEQPIVGWQADAGATVAAVDADAHEGKRSVRFTAREGAARLTSSPIKTSGSGRLSLSVWLKSPAGAQPSLRLALVGQAAGKSYYRYAAVGGEGAGSPELNREWKQFVFPLHDLPSQGLADLRVRFELSAAGEVLIDDVRLNDLEFSDHERLELTKAISLAEYRLQHGEYDECARLLEGYWPRYLTAYVPMSEAALTAAKPQPRPAPAAPATATGDGSRRWWPTFLR